MSQKIKIEVGQIWLDRDCSGYEREIIAIEFDSNGRRAVREMNGQHAIFTYLDKDDIAVLQDAWYLKDDGKQMKFINETMKKRWAEVKEQVKNDPKSTTILNFAEAWAVLMEAEMSNGAKLADIARKTSDVADKQFGAISGSMFQVAVDCLIACWFHGKELQAWHGRDDGQRLDLSFFNLVQLLSTSMEFISSSSQELWEAAREQHKNHKDIILVLDYAEDWAVLMQERLALGESLAEFAGETGHEAARKYKDRVTGNHYRSAAEGLINCWIHGAPFKEWYEHDEHGRNAGPEEEKTFFINMEDISAFINMKDIASAATGLNDETLRTYHAHVYQPKAFLGARQHAKLYKTLMTNEKLKHLKFHPIHTKPIGPHLKPMFEIDFNEKDFTEVVNFFMLSRGNCSVLIHPITGKPLADHTKHAIWLGDKVKLDLGKV